MYKLGLIGTPISHSFSKLYFDTKFKNENITDFHYSLYDIKNIEQLDKIYTDNLIGLNVTQPYKKEVLKHLDILDLLVQTTQSANTIFINPKNKKKSGFNTDVIGFEALLSHLIIPDNTKALILGSGGVSNTISYVLSKNNIEHKIVSRKPNKHTIIYKELNNQISDFKLIINTTPLGQYPNNNSCPSIPYDLISHHHQCIDLIYNPGKTLFLQKMEHQGASIFNGKKMLIAQAEASWTIWNNMLKII